MQEISNLTNTLIQFRNARDWAQFHNPKDLALALSIEAGELNECFLWKKPEEANREKVAEELADVFVGSSRVDLQACKLEYSIVSPK